jgi:hypothetical protein
MYGMLLIAVLGAHSRIDCRRRVDGMLLQCKTKKKKRRNDDVDDIEFSVQAKTSPPTSSSDRKVNLLPANTSAASATRT